MFTTSQKGLMPFFYVSECEFIDYNKIAKALKILTNITKKTIY